MRPSQSIPLANRIIAVLLCVIWLCQTGMYPAVLAMLEGVEQNHSVQVQWENGGATVTLHHSAGQACHQHDMMEHLVLLWAADSQESDHVVKTSGVTQDVRSSLRLMAREDAPVVDVCWDHSGSLLSQTLPKAARPGFGTTEPKLREAVRLRSVQLTI